MFRIFYNHEVSGDVIFILIDPEAEIDEVISQNEVTALKHEGQIVGYNIFKASSFVKLHSKGAIFAPTEELIKLINYVLVNAKFPELPKLDSSGFKVMKIIAIEEHPLNEKASIVTLSCDKEKYSAVSSFTNLGIGKYVVVALNKTILFDGSVFHSDIDHNIRRDVAIMSGKELLISESQEAFIVSDIKEGDDFFYGQ